MEQVEPIRLPELAQHERAAVAALLARHSKTWWARKRLQDEKIKLEVSIAEADVVVKNCESGLKAFGLNVDDAPTWKAMGDEFGDDVRALLNPASSATSASTSASSASEGSVEALPTPAPQPRVSVQDILLDRLKELGSQGSKSALLRGDVERKLGRAVHEKTVGMSLYRLLNRGRVRRNGHTWYFVPPVAETENPGGSAPGSEARSNGKEVET